MVIVSAEVLLCPIGFSIPREGDWAVYSVHAVWNPNITDESVQKAIEYYENIDGTNWTLTIQKFDYPEVAVSIVKPLKNGTNSESYEGNVETGNPDLGMWMVSANLSEGERIYRHGAELNVSIKSEEPYEFADAIRDVVYTNFNRTESGVVSHFGVFWDRETGILSGMSSIRKYYDENFDNLLLTAKVDIVIVETSLWMKTTPGHDESIWPVIVTLIVLFSILVVVVVLFRKRKRKKKAGLRR